MKDLLSRIKFNIGYLLRPSKYDSKVFCIGFNKTGTTSLGKALEDLGYVNSSFNSKVWNEYYKAGKIDKVLHYTSKFDSCDDLPWLLEDFFPILDKKFPNSKFIYLLREDESWKRSFKNWGNKHNGEDPDMLRAFNHYKKHQNFVYEYFKDRPSDLLKLDVQDPEGMKKLASFLNKSTDKNRLPHYNKA